VAQVANESDIAECIRWAREHGIAPVARGGGHSYAGYSTNRGLVIDLGRLNRVVVNPRKGTAVVGGAALNANALAATKGGEWVLPRHLPRRRLLACRGGAGGNFGINTTLKFRLAKVPVKQVAFYSYRYQGADAAAAVLAAFDKLCETAPPESNADSAAQATPVGTGGPREAIDVFSRGQFLGSVDELRELVRPLELAAPATSLQLETFD
jgi:FAD/FMN-containing dehydrogenase